MELPENVYAYLSRACIQRGFLAQAIAIAHSGKLTLKNYLDDIIKVHIAAGKVEACYLLIHNYME